MNLPKIHSITKKLFVALVGGFLLLFLLFHMTANLFILRHDEGQWYSDFCHFMGTNWVVKIFEVLLFGVIALHILLTVWLAITNRMARPTRYHQRSKSKTHPGSKLMMWTGILIFVCLIIHFCDFYFVKIGWVKGEYMVETEKVTNEEIDLLVQYAKADVPPTEAVQMMEDEVASYANQMNPMELSEYNEQIQLFHTAAPIATLIVDAEKQGHITNDGKWIRHIDYDQRQMLREKMPDCGVEPDFYYMAREKFSHWHIVLGYLFFFFVIFMHLRHAFPSAFQTLGLNNYKYNPIIEALGKIYTWLIVLGFASVPILVYLGL